MPPRYLPTLTEVVRPRVREDGDAAVATPQERVEVPAVLAPVAVVSDDPVGMAMETAPPAEPPVVPSPAAAPVSFAAPTPDRHALAQQLIKLVQPQLEAELRSIAQELFEAQFSALLPSMQLQIEEAVRDAIDQTLPRPSGD